MRTQNALFKTLTTALALGMALIGCNQAPQHVLGVAPAALVTATTHELASASSDKKVTLQGEMIEKCPVAGCWFMLKDKTGVVRVDTKAAGFVVSDVPLHTTMTVSGQVVPGTEPQVAATGIRY
ncbi:MAG TPA: hypothetical protein VKU00_02330 [Chthonomonadaceae bacterium]|nr:hypothetical protein [Chthonomonadaceae bacterium]